MNIHATFGSNPLDWGVPVVNSANANHNIVDESGRTLETRHFDSLFNANGDRIVLPAGERFRDTRRDSLSDQSALIVTKFWSLDQRVQSKSLEIRSPYMKAALKEVVPAYKSVEKNAQAIRIKGPPHFLFHYRLELQQYGMNLEQADPDGARHIHFLLEYMWDEFRDETTSFYSSLYLVGDDVPILEFKYLWMAYRPKDVMLIRQREQRDQSSDSFGAAIQFVSMELEEDRYWEVTGYRIDFDDGLFGYTKQTSRIRHYNGSRSINDLELVPLHYITEPDAVRSRLLARGRKFLGLHGQHHRLYEGIGSILPMGGMRGAEDEDYRSQMIRSRIMVDRAAFVEAYPYAGIYFTASEKVFHAEDFGSENMSPEELIICADSVYGYSLRNNAWGRFRIDNIQDTGLDTSAFEELILQPAYKNQILSLVQVHEDKRLKFDDFIKGKGRGVVFLLYGEPGTGKTLTAEGIADYCRKPLLRLDAGTLGTTAESVEDQLSAAFKIAEKWHAVVLLDEADVFLEQREPHGLLRNALVSVFLRMLEYYQGILILTTNRVACFDAAFKSRIHLAIRYPSLCNDSRRTLWQTFLRRVSEQAADELGTSGVLERFADEPLNGRQIKNLIRTASALAINDETSGGRLLPSHLASALEPMKNFMSDMESESTGTTGSAPPTSDAPMPKKRRIA